MSDQHDSSKDADPTVITLVLPADASQSATITVRNGSLGHMDTFAYDGFKDVCVALNDGMTAFVQVQGGSADKHPISDTEKDSQASGEAAVQAVECQRRRPSPGQDVRSL